MVDMGDMVVVEVKVTVVQQGIVALQADLVRMVGQVGVVDLEVQLL